MTTGTAKLSAAARVRPAASLARVRLAAGTWLGRAAAAASRLAGRGSGTSIRGTVLLRVDPDALRKLLAGKRVAMVSGTNGKTTTTHFLAAAVRARFDPDNTQGRVVHNADGANLRAGIASALSQAPGADLAILETDERVVADLVRLGRPEVLVLLNFSRDQLDRHHEIKGLGRSWRQALADAGDAGPVVVANADEPLIVWAAQTARQVVWVNTASTWTQDASLCPNCGATLVRDQPAATASPSQVGSDNAGELALAPAPATGSATDWRCSRCDLRKPPADYAVEDGLIVDRDGHAWDPRLQVPGRFNVSNAACALAAAELLGVEPDTALAGMRTVTSPAGRFATVRFGDTSARLLLAKNPAGWAEALPLATTQTVVLAIDSAAADGRDVSWLWDVEYERLRGRTVVATGPRAQDLAVRLAYADIEYRCIPDLAEAVTGHRDPVDVIATYTPFQRLRKLGGV